MANETERKLAERERDTAEKLRLSSEEIRKKNEEKRIESEETRKNAETSRVEAEAERDTAEKERKSNEEARKSAEQERANAEITREEKEESRESNEETRQSNEEERKANELERQANEQERKTSEEERKIAETAREEYIIELKGRVENGEFKGDPNTLKIGKVTKGDEAQATIEGDAPNQILNLVLPKGDKGDKGEQGNVSLEQMNKAIADAVGKIHGFDCQIVDVLPETGEKGVIYLIPNEGIAPNVYDEYMWLGSNFEKIGTTEVDLSQYAKSKEVTIQINTVKTELEKNISNNTNKITELEINVTQNKTDIASIQNTVENNIPIGNTITISLDSWVKNSETQYYEYDVKDETVTSNTKIIGDLKIEDQNKINSRGYVNSYNGGYKIILTDKPLGEITIDIVKIKAQVI